MSDKLLACIEEDLHVQRTTIENNKGKDEKEGGQWNNKKRKLNNNNPYIGSKLPSSAPESKDTSRTLRTKAEAIRLLQTTEEKLVNAVQTNHQLREQFNHACDKITALEGKLEDAQHKIESLMKEMLERSEQQNHLLFAQSTKITNRVVDAVLPSNRDAELKTRLVMIRNECQYRLPPFPSVPVATHTNANDDVRKRYRNELQGLLRLHEPNSNTRDLCLQQLSQTFIKNSTRYAMDRELLCQLEHENPIWREERLATELSIGCLDMAVKVLQSAGTSSHQQEQKQEARAGKAKAEKETYEWIVSKESK